MKNFGDLQLKSFRYGLTPNSDGLDPKENFKQFQTSHVGYKYSNSSRVLDISSMFEKVNFDSSIKISSLKILIHRVFILIWVYFQMEKQQL